MDPKGSGELCNSCLVLAQKLCLLHQPSNLQDSALLAAVLRLYVHMLYLSPAVPLMLLATCALQVAFVDVPLV
jgi:hypothetical protein